MTKLDQTEIMARIEEEYGDDLFVAMDSQAGLCVCCGEFEYGVEPDARNYPCPACGEPGVFGIEEILITSL